MSKCMCNLAVSAGLLLGLAGCGQGFGRLAGRVDDQPLQTGRPRLFLRQAEWKGGLSLAQLRQRATTQPFADRVRLLRSTRANLAMKWLITGDEQAASDCLDALRKFKPKLSTSDEGAELIDVALAYDWLFAWPKFTDDDKRQVERGMLALADEMVGMLKGAGGHVFHTRMYAWASGVGMAGLALHDVSPRAGKLLRFACDYYENELLPARKLQGGAMHNGLSYGPNYMMHPLIQFLEAAKSAASLDYFHTPNAADSDWLREMAWFLIHSVRPDMEHVKYADHATEDPAKQFRFMLDCFAAEYNNGCAAELARRISERFKTSGYHAEWIYMFFAFHNPAVTPRPLDELPTFRVFSPHGVGQVFWRSDWSADATMLHFRCGDYFEDHGHFDQGSFTLFRRGDLALQAGGYWGFDTPHRHHYYKQAIAANTVIFSDPADPADEGRQRNVRYQEARTFADYLAHKRPDAKPCVETGEIVAVDDPKYVVCEPAPAAAGTRNEFHSIVADVTAAWDPAKVKRYIRRLAIVNNKHVVIVDETETTRPAIRARWLLHTQREPAPTAHPGSPVWPAAYIVPLTDSQLAVQSLVPVRVTLIGGPGRECEVNGTNYGYLDLPKFVQYHKDPASRKLDPRQGIWRMEMESPVAGTRRLFVTVLTADTLGAEPAPAAAKLDGDKLAVTVDGRTVEFLGVRK